MAPVELPTAETAAAFLGIALSCGLAGFAAPQHCANTGQQFAEDLP